MKYTELPSWVKNLKEDPKLADIGFSIFDESQFQEANQKGNTRFTFGKKKKTLFTVGHSESFGNHNLIGICVDPERTEEARITLNGTDSPIYFYSSPSVDSIARICSHYRKKGLGNSQVNIPASIARLRQGTAETISDPQKKELLFLYGYGDWDDMAELENQLVFNPFLSLNVLCLATAGDNKGNMSQYCTAFSSSLCSVIRYRISGIALYFLSFEYLPSETSYTKQVKAEYADSPVFRQFPDDTPLDIIGMCHQTSNVALMDADRLLKQTQKKGLLDCAVMLTAMINLNGKFEEYFLPLATYPNRTIRDYVASEACDRDNQTVLAKAIECGVSKKAMNEILAKYPSLSQGNMGRPLKPRTTKPKGKPSKTAIRTKISQIIRNHEELIQDFIFDSYDLCNIEQYFFIDDKDNLQYASGDHLESDPAYSSFHLLIHDTLPPDGSSKDDMENEDAYLEPSHGKDWKKLTSRLKESLTLYFESKSSAPIPPSSNTGI